MTHHHAYWKHEEHEHVASTPLQQTMPPAWERIPSGDVAFHANQAPKVYPCPCYACGMAYYAQKHKNPPLKHKINQRRVERSSPIEDAHDPYPNGAEFFEDMPEPATLS